MQCGARQCNAEAVWCAQQQPIALNPGVDGADLANLEAHPLERVCLPYGVSFEGGGAPVRCVCPPLQLSIKKTKGGNENGHSTRRCATFERGATHKRALPSGHAAHTLVPRSNQRSCTVARQGQRAAQLSVYLHHLPGVRINALAGHQARRRVGAVRSAEEQDVRLRPGGGRCGGRLRACDQVAHATRERWTSRWLAPVDGVVHPPAALLHAHAAPLRLSQQPPLGRILGNVFGQDDMTACGGTERERACELASSLSSEHASNTRARAGAEEAGAAPVLKLVVEILLRVLDLLGRHYAAGEGGGLHARGGLHTREPGARA